MNSTGKTIVVNSGLLIGAEIVNKAIRVGVVILMARMLGAEIFGQFSFARSYVALFVILADIGIHQLLVREIARKPDKVESYFGNALFIKLFLSLLTLAVIGISIQFFNKSPDVKITVYILAFDLVAMSFIELVRAVFHAFQKMIYDVHITLITSVGTTLLALAVLLLGGGIMHLAAVYLVMNVVSLIYGGWVLTRKFTAIRFNLDRSIMRFQIIEGIPFGINTFFSILYNNVNSVLLSVLATDAAVGWYNAAHRLFFVLVFLSMGVMKAVYPALSRYFHEDREKFANLVDRSFKVLLYFGVSISVLLSLLARKITLFLYGEEYLNTASVLVVLGWTLTLIFLIFVMTYTTRSADRQRFTAKVVGFSAVLNVGLNYILIPRFSFMGAAFATLFTEFSTFIFHYFFLSRHLVKPPLLKYLPKVLVINGTTAAWILLLKPVHLLIVGPSALLVNLGMAWLVRYFDPHERALLKQIIQRKSV